MTIVYRVEDVNGEGPYQSKYANGWLDHFGAESTAPAFIRDLYTSDAMDPDPHPSPYNDGIDGRINHDEFFGFHTLTSLAAWMLREPEDAHKLNIAGYHVSVFEVDRHDVRVGSRQVVFTRRRASKVRTYTLHDVEALLPIPNEEPA